MLSSLQIENVAVIQKAEVHFEPGLNVLTGETGISLNLLTHSSRLRFSNIPPGRHSESGLHTPAGHCR